MPIFGNYFTKGFYPFNNQGAFFKTPWQSLPQGNRQQMEEAERIHLCNAAFWAAVQQLVKPARAARLKVEKKQGDNWVEDEKHEIQMWWKKAVNPEMNGRVWIEGLINHLCVYGIFRNEWTPKGMASPDDRDADGKPLFRGDANEPPWLTPIVPYVLVPDIRANLTETERQGIRFKMPTLTNKYGRLFRYMHAVSEDLNYGYPVQVSDVFVQKHYNPVRGYIGISPLLLVSNILGMGDSLVKHAYSYMKNHGIPSGVVTYAADSQKYQSPLLQGEEKKAVEQAYMNMFAQDGERPNSPAFFPAGIDFKPLSADLDTLMPAELWDIVQAIVHEVLGTSPTEALVGLRHGNNRASAKSHQTSVWLYTVEPLLEYTLESLSTFLFPRFGQERQFEDGKVRLAWDFNKVPAYREIQENYTKQLLQAVKDQIAQINEGRKALGLPEDPELTGQYLKTAPSAFGNPDTQDPTANGDGSVDQNVEPGTNGNGKPKMPSKAKPAKGQPVKGFYL